MTGVKLAAPPAIAPQLDSMSDHSALGGVESVADLNLPLIF
ncbi:hypothetical protein [Brasilonema octagenarum]|nr:hypothetical protein [Brasilonema octagenarum]